MSTRTYPHRPLAGLLLLLGLLLFSPATRAQERQVLRGHRPPGIDRMQPQGRLEANTTVKMAIGLPSRDPAGLKLFLEQLYDSNHPNFRQYLTPEQFTERYAPTKEDYQAVLDFAKANGLKVTQIHPNRLLVDVEGPASAVEKAFQVKLFNYRHPKEARNFRAPDVEPTVPAGLKIADVSGLNDFPRPHPNSHIGNNAAHPAGVQPQAGSMGGQYIGNDFRTAYVPGTPLNGSGQNIALVQFDGYYLADITRYRGFAGLASVTLTNVLLDGFSGTPTTGANSGNGEVSLDIEMVISMAPGLSKVFVYEGNPANFIPNDVLNRIANDNSSRQISCSWGWTGGPSITTDFIFQQMAAQGQSFFVASGDDDAYVGAGVDSAGGFGTPVASAYVTSVGGTTLSTSGAGGNWSGETVWNWGVEFFPNNNGVGSSGGYSAYYSQPIWQKGVSMANNQGSTTGRNFPDVALTGDHVFVAYGNGSTNWFGGTSCAAPLWAGFIALVNQQAVSNGVPSVGFLNPSFYALGKSATYSNCFHDITTGNSQWSNSPSAYSGVSGYDLCTGWGTPNGTNLINALLNVTPLLPSTVFVTGGNGNGAVDPNECNQLYMVLQNYGALPASGVNVTLSSSTAGVTILQPSSSYPTINAQSGATNTTPFQISTSPAFVCGTTISLTTVISYSGGILTNVFTLPSCQVNFYATGTLTNTNPTQTGRLARTGTPTTCSGESCPGLQSSTGARAYDKYSFTNSSASSVCVSVTVATGCTNVFSVSYLGNFTASSPCANYLGDMGYTTPNENAYAFTVPAHTNFNVVVHVLNPGESCGNYGLTVSYTSSADGGGACPGPQLAVTPASQNFGTITVGNSNQTSFVVTNTGSGTLIGTASTISPFGIATGASYSIVAGQSASVTVFFQPVSAGNFSNAVVLTSNGGASTNFVFGIGVTPANLVVTPSSLDFGTVAVSSSAQASFIVSNSGGATLTGTATAGGAFSIFTGSPYSLAGFAATNLTVSFNPSSTAAFSTNIIFTSNGGVSTKAVTGNGAVPPSASFTGSPTSGTAPLNVTFTDSSTGTIANRSWNFGDATMLTTNALSFVHTYNTTGTNTVILSVTGPLGTSTATNLNYIIVTNVIPQADLTLGVAVAPASVPVGQNIIYTLAITNLGPALASSVTVTDILPPNVTFQSATPTRGVCTNIGGTVICNFGDLDITSNAAATIVITPTIASSLTNFAATFSSTMDPNPTNNAVLTVATAGNVANLAILGSSAPNPVLTSQTFTYLFTVTNAGPATATGVTVTDALPASVAFVSASSSVGSCSNNGGGLVTCTLGSLDTNTLATIMIVGIPSASANIVYLTNTASVSANEFDLSPADNQVPVITTVYLDSVGDGIPDWWRLQYFGVGNTTNSSSCATCDADGDGSPNNQEYRAGTSPTSSTSVLAITGSGAVGANFLFRFNSVVGQAYQVESTTNLNPVVWSPVTNFTATDTSTVITNPIASQPQLFFRVRLLP